MGVPRSSARSHQDQEVAAPVPPWLARDGLALGSCGDCLALWKTENPPANPPPSLELWSLVITLRENRAKREGEGEGDGGWVLRGGRLVMGVDGGGCWW